MIKMIVMDMDGTLLDKHNHILPKTFDTLMQLQKKGVRLVLASGRSYMRLLPYAKQLQMDTYAGYLVEVNGTAVYDLKNNKREILAQLEEQHIQEIFQYFMKWNLEIIGQFDDGMFDYIPLAMIKEKKAYIKTHHMMQDVPLTAGAFQFVANKKEYPNLTYIHSPKDIKQNLNKISVSYHPDILQDITAQAKKDLKGKYWAGLTSPRWLEIMLEGVNKASGLRHVSKLSGISFDEMIAFGDSENDIEMLQKAGVGIAMENAFDHVKKQADFVTLSNNDNGIAYALEHLFKC